ncbi:MAG: branched-chain amino acid ABC transporter substrate-binding protein [Rhodanobacteraceae bacterium]
MRKWIAVGVGVAALSLSVGMASAAPAPETAPLRIAFIDPLSGPMASVGIPEVATFKYSAELINKEGGIDGRKVEIVPLDNKLSVQETLVQFQHAVDEGIHYVTLGDGDAFAAALLNAVNQHNKRDEKDRVLFLNYAAIGPQFVNSDCSFWHFLFDANNDMKMNLLTDYIAKQNDVHKVFLQNQDYGFGKRFSQDAITMLKKKRPDIKIAGDVFTPLAQVKDFTPYVTQIKASGADAVLTGNWGSDLILFAKAAAQSGLHIPFYTYYSTTPGTVTAIGKRGVGMLYEIDAMDGDYTNPVVAQREVQLKKETGWDYSGFIRATYEIRMLKLAAEKAKSIDPTKVAFALEGLEFNGPYGPVYMRADNHQIEMPMFISVLQDHMKYGLLKTGDLNFHVLAKFTAKEGQLPTTCKMHRPARPQ